MTYQPIIGTLGYVVSMDRKQVLLVHRNARQNDDHLGKYNGLGGKLLPHEEIITGMRREIMEEAGIHCVKMSLRGTVNWTGFGKRNEDWLGFIFVIDAFEGEPYRSNEEGDLEWVALEDLISLPMWEGDRYFLPLVFDEDPRPFHGYLPYVNGKPVGWSYERC